MTLLRRLNHAGIQRLVSFLESLKTETPEDIPEEILLRPETSQDVGVAIEVDRRTFGSRLEAAPYLDGKLSGSGLNNIERDTGLCAGWCCFILMSCARLTCGVGAIQGQSTLGLTMERMFSKII